MKKGILILLFLALMVFIFLMAYRPRPHQLTTFLINTELIDRGGDLTVQFLGNTNLLFSDGKNAILTDGFFSNPSLYQIIIGKISPDEDAVSSCLKLAEIHINFILGRSWESIRPTGSPCALTTMRSSMGF